MFCNKNDSGKNEARLQHHFRQLLCGLYCQNMGHEAQRRPTRSQLRGKFTIYTTRVIQNASTVTLCLKMSVFENSEFGNR